MAGLRTYFQDGVPVTAIADERQYRAYLRARGLSDEAIEEQLRFELSIPLETSIAGIASFQERLQNLRDWCLDRVPEYAEVLAKVPYDAMHVGHFQAFAAPGPTAGGVILYSSGSSFLWQWISWIMMLTNETKTPIDPTFATQKELLRSLPDLAEHIVHGTPCRAMIRFIALMSVHFDALYEDRLENRVWFADAFVMLHEFAHIALGHTDRSRAWLTEPSRDEEELRARRELARTYELDADMFAAERLWHTEPIEDVYAAIIAVTSLFRLAEEEGVVPDGFETHPAAVERFRRMAMRYLPPGMRDDPDSTAIVEMLYYGAYDLRRQAAEGTPDAPNH